MRHLKVRASEHVSLSPLIGKRCITASTSASNEYTMVKVTHINLVMGVRTFLETQQKYTVTE